MTIHMAPNAIRTNELQGLTGDELRRFVPSLYATEAHSSRSDRYEFIPTIDIMRELGREGFRVMQAMQSRTRSADKREFTKHMVRMRHVRDDGKYTSLRPEVVIVNSHDGSSSYVIAAGLHIFACSNGLITGDNLSMVRVHHGTKDVSSRVVEGSLLLVERSARTVEHAGRMESVMLDHFERGLFCERAAIISGKQLRASDLDFARRSVDTPHTLWHTFNRVQENLIKGGTRMSSGRRARPVLSIDADFNINTGLWGLAAETYANKTGKALINA